MKSSTDVIIEIFFTILLLDYQVFVALCFSYIWLYENKGQMHKL